MPTRSLQSFLGTVVILSAQNEHAATKRFSELFGCRPEGGNDPVSRWEVTPISSEREAEVAYPVTMLDERGYAPTPQPDPTPPTSKRKKKAA